jgi:hypothetical protein
MPLTLYYNGYTLHDVVTAFDGLCDYIHYYYLTHPFKPSQVPFSLCVVCALGMVVPLLAYLLFVQFLYSLQSSTILLIQGSIPNASGPVYAWYIGGIPGFSRLLLIQYCLP